MLILLTFLGILYTLLGKKPKTRVWNTHLGGFCALSTVIANSHAYENQLFGGNGSIREALSQLCFCNFLPQYIATVMDRQCCVIVLHINILLCSTMPLHWCMFLLMCVKFLKMLKMYSNNTRSLTCKVNSKSVFQGPVYTDSVCFYWWVLNNHISCSSILKIFTLFKLKEPEKYYVVYQEKIMLPKKVKEIALIYQLKETRKE